MGGPSFFIPMYTLDDILQAAHQTYEGNIEYPEAGSDDYSLRTGFVSQAIKIWAHNQNVTWKELYASASQTTTSGQAYIATPSDFMEIASYVLVDGVAYNYAKPQDVIDIQTNNRDTHYFWITGSPGSYRINFSVTPTENGLSISYTYLKKPTTSLTGSTVLPMSKPDFALYYLLARLYELDTRNDMVTYYERKAKDVMDEMIIENEVPPPNTPNNLPDGDTNFAFGV